MKRIFISDASLKVAANNSDYYTFREKLNVAKYLSGVNADAIELPTVKNSKEDYIVYKTICSTAGDACVKMDSGVTDESAKCAAEAIKTAKNACLQVVLPVSTVQMEYTYHKKAPAMLETISKRVSFAKTLFDKVEYVAADASRAEIEYLTQACVAAVNAGATEITVCDDAAVWLPEDAEAAIKTLVKAINVPVNVRASNKIGVGIAVLSAAIRAGAAGAVTSAINGEYVSTVAFADFIAAKGEDIGVTAKIDHTAIHRDTENVVKTVKVGAKESGQSVKIRITGESTLADVAAAVKLLGYDISDSDAGKVYEEARRILNRKSVIESRELEAIIATSAMQAPSTYHLDSYVVNCGNIINATAQITLTSDNGKLSGVAVGDGPIDAAFKVIEQIIGHHYELDDFQIQTVTEGRESVGHALVKLRHKGRLYSGNGVSTDIVGASVRAYLNALNKIIYEAK